MRLSDHPDKKKARTGAGDQKNNQQPHGNSRRAQQQRHLAYLHQHGASRGVL